MVRGRNEICINVIASIIRGVYCVAVLYCTEPTLTPCRSCGSCGVNKTCNAQTTRRIDWRKFRRHPPDWRLGIRCWQWGVFIATRSPLLDLPQRLMTPSVSRTERHWWWFCWWPQNASLTDTVRFVKTKSISSSICILHSQESQTGARRLSCDLVPVYVL